VPVILFSGAVYHPGADRVTGQAADASGIRPLPLVVLLPLSGRTRGSVSATHARMEPTEPRDCCFLPISNQFTHLIFREMESGTGAAVGERSRRRCRGQDAGSAGQGVRSRRGQGRRSRATRSSVVLR